MITRRSIYIINSCSVPEENKSRQNTKDTARWGRGNRRRGNRMGLLLEAELEEPAQGGARGAAKYIPRFAARRKNIYKSHRRRGQGNRRRGRLGLLLEAEIEEPAHGGARGAFEYTKACCTKINNYLQSHRRWGHGNRRRGNRLGLLLEAEIEKPALGGGCGAAHGLHVVQRLKGRVQGILQAEVGRRCQVLQRLRLRRRPRRGRPHRRRRLVVRAPRGQEDHLRRGAAAAALPPLFCTGAVFFCRRLSDAAAVAAAAAGLACRAGATSPLLGAGVGRLLCDPRGALRAAAGQVEPHAAGSPSAHAQA
mmetsp:Transcript_22739/g.35955  ORF Transcript_22739/g.35955 Transcript_22739/m.35955 type:complete len:308 (+) Transcript_22739:114-1037(+)